ncbi:hypothetical protein BH11PLA1_BH11PLA1_10140 [soil metagenome]
MNSDFSPQDGAKPAEQPRTGPRVAIDLSSSQTDRNKVEAESSVGDASARASSQVELKLDAVHDVPGRSDGYSAAHSEPLDEARREWTEAISACPSRSPEQYFEAMYECADGDSSRVPWAECRPNPLLIDWLARSACQVVRAGARAAVVGCGLGDDLSELLRRGYDAMGFDCSATAVRWAARRHPRYADRFVQADLLNLPMRMQGRFDLVVEIATIQSVHPSLRRLFAAGLAKLAAPRGAIMVLTRARQDDDELDPHDGPPWPVSKRELIAMMELFNLCPRGEVELLHAAQGGDDRVARPWLLGTFVKC